MKHSILGARLRWMRVCALAGVMAGALAACDGEGTAPVIPGEGDGKGPVVTIGPVTPPAKERIVCFAPALTRTLADMGKLDLVVGVAQNDALAPKGAAVVGHAFTPDTEKLLAAKPTLVLTMAGQAEPPAALQRLAEEQAFRLVVYPYPKSVRDVLNIVVDDAALAIDAQGALQEASGQSLAVLLKDRRKGFEVSERLVERLTAINRSLPLDRRPRTLLVIGTEPALRVVGPGTVLDEILTTYAGGENAVIPAAVIPKATDPRKVPELKAPEAAQGAVVGPAPVLDRERLLALRPQVVILLSPGGPPLRPLAEDPRLRDFRDLDIPATRANAFHLLDDPAVMLAESTALADIAQAIARVLHPGADPGKPVPAPAPAPAR